MTGRPAMGDYARVTDPSGRSSHPDLRELVQVLWRHWSVLLAAVLMFAALAVAIGRALPPNYPAPGNPADGP